MSTRLGFAALLAIPASAFAGSMGSALGYASQWSGSALGYARALFPALVLVGLVLEILFRDPAAPPSFRNTFWRAAIVLSLLMPVGGQTLYGRLCGVMAGVSDSLTATLAPADPWADFSNLTEKWHTQMEQARKPKEASIGQQADTLAAELGGFVFETLLSLALLLGQASLWVMKQIASVLVILLYALGPLALVFWIPLKSDSLGRWLRTFITVLTWPVMAAAILGIITRASLQGFDGASPAFASLATALLLGVTALAVPIVSSSLVGGSMGAIGSGMATLMQTAGLGTAMATTAAGIGAGGAGASAAAGSAKALGGAVGGALQADGPLALGPSPKVGPRGVGQLVPNAIDSIPGTPVLAQPGLAVPPPPPPDAVSGRMGAPKPVASAGRFEARPPPPVPSAAMTADPQPARAPAMIAAPHAAAEQLERGAPAPGRTPPAAHAAHPNAHAGAPLRGAAPPTQPVKRQAHVLPPEETPTAPAVKKPASWNATIDRLGTNALELEHAPDSPTRDAELRKANAKIDRAVKAAHAGLSVEDWASDEAKRDQ